MPGLESDCNFKGSHIGLRSLKFCINLHVKIKGLQDENPHRDRRKIPCMCYRVRFRSLEGLVKP
jgi:hypothetical protein